MSAASGGARRRVLGGAIAIATAWMASAGWLEAQATPDTVPSRSSGAPIVFDSVLPPVNEHATRDHYLLLAAGAIATSTFNQATAMPVQWKRTWRGYGARLGDQAGFLLVEESLYYGLSAAMPWRGEAMACPGARANSGRGLMRRAGAAGVCGVVNTLVVRNADGERRPNLPLLGAIVGASAASLAWRPERATAGKGQMFVLTRIGLVSGGAALKKGYGEFGGR